MFFRPALGGVVSWLADRRKQISIIAAWVIAVGLVLAWSLRPAGPTRPVSGAVVAAVGSVQQADGVPVHPETYAEQSMQWISWYIGPIALILGIAGLCILTVLAIRRGIPSAVIILAIAAPLTAIYIWNPSNTPIQITAIRRYVVAPLPLLFLAAAVAIDRAASLCERLFRGTAWRQRVLVAGAAGVIVFPLGATLPVARFQGQANFLPLIDHTCRVIGPDAAVLFPANDADGAVLTQTLRSWCNVPVSSLAVPVIGGAQLQQVAASFKTEGKTLWMLGATPNVIRAAAPTVTLTPALIGTAQSPRELEQSVDRPAQHYAQSELTIYGGPVP